MLKKVVSVTAVLAAVLLVGGLILGRSLLRGVLLTGREKIQQQTRDLGLVDPGVELEAVAEQVARDLPKTLSELKLAARDLAKEQVVQAEALRETQSGLTLVEADLRSLAPAVVEGQGAELRGRRLAPEEAKSLAGRLIHRQRDYQKMIQARTALLGKLTGEQEQLEHEIAAAETAISSFTSRKKHLEAKIALVKAGQRVEALKTASHRHASAAMPGSLDQLDRQLEGRLLEQQARQQIREEDAAPDRYIATVRDESLLAELEDYAKPQEVVENKEKGK